MYKNIGLTLKTLAIVLVVVGCIKLFDGFMRFDSDLTLWQLFDFGAWLVISSFPLYGFGQLIESTVSIEKSLNELLKSQTFRQQGAAMINQENLQESPVNDIGLQVPDNQEGSTDGTELSENDKKFISIGLIIVLACIGIGIAYLAGH